MVTNQQLFLNWMKIDLFKSIYSVGGDEVIDKDKNTLNLQYKHIFLN